MVGGGVECAVGWDGVCGGVGWVGMGSGGMGSVASEVGGGRAVKGRGWWKRELMQKCRAFKQ